MTPVRDNRALRHAPIRTPEGHVRPQLDPLSHGVLFSLAANMTGLVVASLMKAPEPIERLQGNADFVVMGPQHQPQFAHALGQR